MELELPMPQQRRDHLQAATKAVLLPKTEQALDRLDAAIARLERLPKSGTGRDLVLAESLRDLRKDYENLGQALDRAMIAASGSDRKKPQEG